MESDWKISNTFDAIFIGVSFECQAIALQLISGIMNNVYHAQFITRHIITIKLNYN